MAKRKKIIWIVVSLFFLLGFIFFTVAAKTKIFDRFDFNTTVRLQNHVPKKYDSFFSTLSLIGSFEILSALLFIIVLFRKKLIAFLIFIPFGTAHLVEILGKGFFHHPSPPFMFIRYNLGFVFPSSYVNTGSSYPSGHSLRTMFVSVIFIYLIKKSKFPLVNKLILYAALFLFDGFMLISRVSLGEHWTSDVIAGTLLGMSSGFFALIFL